MRFLKKLGIVIATPVAATFTFYQFKPPRLTDTTGLPLIYDPEQIKTFWKKHPRHILYRLLEVNGQLFPFFLRFLFARKTCSDWDDVRSKEYAKELKHLLISLGPTYIKFGQVLSMRPDVVSALFFNAHRQSNQLRFCGEKKFKMTKKTERNGKRKFLSAFFVAQPSACQPKTRKAN